MATVEQVLQAVADEIESEHVRQQMPPMKNNFHLPWSPNQRFAPAASTLVER